MIDTIAAGVVGTSRKATSFNTIPDAGDRLVVDDAPIGRTFGIADPRTAILFAPRAAQLLLDDATYRPVGEGDVVLLAPGGTMAILAGPAEGWWRVAGPRRFLSPALPGRDTAVLPRSAATEALRRHLAGLRGLLAEQSDALPTRFLAHGVRELLGAATVAGIAPLPRSARRDDALLDRIVACVDARLGEDIGVAGLCQALGCSRSALYRAAAPAGGLVELAMQRRLLAVYAALRAPDERRCIAEVARSFGFGDASQFSRRFRRAFGISAGQARAAGRGPADGVLFDPGHARVFAVAGRAGAGEGAGGSTSRAGDGDAARP